MIKFVSQKLISDYLVFIKNLGTTKVVIVNIYVNDFFFIMSDITKINFVKSFLDDQYKIKDLGSYLQFMETRLERNLEEKTISLSQKLYIEKTLEYADILDCEFVHTLIFSGINFQKKCK